MPKSYWTKIQTPDGLKYFRADEVTDELLQKIKDEASNVFWAEYDVTSFDDIKDAYDAGKSIYVVKPESRNSYIYSLKNYFHYESDPAMDQFLFTCMCQSEERLITCFTSNWNTSATRHFADYSDVSALSGSVAPRYSTIPCPIPKGTYATKNNVLYKANTEITSESTYATWDDSQWDLVTVGGELSKNIAYVDILTTPFSEVLALYNQGQDIVARSNHEFYPMIDYREDYGGNIVSFDFQRISGPVIYTWTVASNGPSESNNWVTPPYIYSNAWIGTSAPLYDETHTYSVGDVVSHYTDLYRCTTDIDVAEPWTDAHWTRTTMAAELKVAVFECRDNGTAQNFFTGPTYAELEAARTSGKTIVLLVHYGFDTVVDRYLEMTYYGFGRGYFDYRFTNPETGAVLQFKGLYSDTETHVWSMASAYDDALSSTSANAVQNKTLYAIITNLQSRMSALEGN